MALFVAACTGQDAFDFLQALGLPAFVALTLPELRLAEAVTNLDGSA